MIGQLMLRRVAEVRQTTLRGNLGHIRDRIDPAYHASTKPYHWDQSLIPHVPSREADLSTTSESSMFKLEIKYD